MTAFARRKRCAACRIRLLDRSRRTLRHTVLGLLARALEAALAEFERELAGLDALVCYAVKANSNLAVLDVFARRGAGFDIVSGGELRRALAAGADPRRIVFSGVGKTAAEMELALAAGILCFNVESAGRTRPSHAVAGRLGQRRRSACASIPT
jgi:diaminopimelate decarboxylase